ncbi:MAG: glycosyltransferase [Actinomycetes bacterium]
MTSVDPPEVSVVVATHNRAALLARLFAALATQESMERAELIVVDDASVDDTQQRLQELARTASFPVTLLHLPESQGPGGARNAGWRDARAPIIVFTDDDCEPQPGWLAALLAGFVEADVVQGRTRPAPEQLHQLGAFGRTINVPASNGFFQTCNVGYRRALLAELDGFDPEFRHVGEDTDLALRAVEYGARASFRADAVVHHDVRPSDWWVHVRTSWRWQGLPLVIRRHPQARRYLVHRVFWRRAHPPAIAGAVGIAIALMGRSRRTRLVGAALSLIYADYRLRREPLAESPMRRALLLPAALAADVNETAVIASGAVKHRTLML